MSEARPFTAFGAEAVGCFGKQAFQGGSEAHAAMRRMNKRRMQGGALEIYRCPHCALWHIGSRAKS